LTIFISFAQPGIADQRRFKQSHSQKSGIILTQVQNRGEHTRLVTPARMQRIQAVLAQFDDVHHRSLCSGQFQLD
jgi:hypothetical protein